MVNVFLNFFIFLFLFISIILWVVFGLLGSRTKYYFNFNNVFIVKNIESNYSNYSKDIESFGNFPSLADIAERKLKEKFRQFAEIDEVTEGAEVIEMGHIQEEDETEEIIEKKQIEQKPRFVQQSFNIEKQITETTIVEDKTDELEEEKEEDGLTYENYIIQFPFLRSKLYELCLYRFVEGFISLETLSDSKILQEFTKVTVFNFLVESNNQNNISLVEKLEKDLNQGLIPYLNEYIVINLMNTNIAKKILEEEISEQEKKQEIKTSVHKELEKIMKTTSYK